MTRAFGNAWLEAKSSPALRVPTLVTPGEWNVLLDPLHPQFSFDWIVSGPITYDFDQRLLGDVAPKENQPPA